MGLSRNTVTAPCHYGDIVVITKYDFSSNQSANGQNQISLQLHHVF